MKKAITLSFALLAMFLLAVQTASAQADTLDLRLSRDWGYGGFNGDIQGLFSMHVSGPETLQRVDFYIDAEKIGEDSEPPFAIQFSTDSYTLGVHTMVAIGVTADGTELRSNEISANFVPAQSVGKFIFPVLVITFLAILGGTLVPLLSTRGKLVELPLGTQRKYGAGGGAICPKCSRPFALPLFSMNIGLMTRLARCPYCGKWGAVRAQRLEKLREAEQAELSWARADAPQISAEEKLKKELDDSRYQTG
jgi:hypothetical protein